MGMVRSSLALTEVWGQRFGAELPVPITTACLLLSFLNWTWLSGTEYGYFYGVFSNPPTSGFAVDGPNYYQSMNVWYLLITSSFLVAIAAGFSRTIGGFVLRIATLSAATYPFINILYFKYDVIVNSGRHDYTWLQNSTYFDIFCLTAIVVLMYIEIMRVWKSTLKNQSRTIKARLGGA
jgi:hypothetical protein